MKTKITKDNIRKLSHKDQVRFALFCAKSVQHKIVGQHALNCIDIVERWLDGKATAEECKIAASKVILDNNYSYTTTAAEYAAMTAINTSMATIDIIDANYYTHCASGNSRNALFNKGIVEYKQEEYLYELLHINEIIEQILLNNCT